MTTVAFLGLGAIGTPMARHLAAPEFTLAVWNRTSGKADAFGAEFGSRVATSPADAATGARVVAVALLAVAHDRARVWRGDHRQAAGH